MNLTIILVNYKSDKNKLLSCLNSIKINTKVLIIDHSHDLIKENLNIPSNLDIKIIKNNNLGNGAGINCGLKYSKTKYALYLDIDVILPRNFFIKINQYVKQIQNFAVLAPKINNFYKETKMTKYGNLSFLKYYYNSLFFKIKKKQTNIQNLEEVFFVSGSIMLINKELTYNKNIQFDEKIFLFYEEDDFFHQCFKNQLKILLIKDITVKHSDGSINDKSLKFECFKKWHLEWSKYYFLNKHYNKSFIFLFALKNMFKFFIKLVFFYFYNKKKYKIILSRFKGLIGYYLNQKCNINYL